MTFTDSMTLGEARELLRTMVEDGVTCPLCTLYARVYRHKCDSAMARTAVRMYRAGAASQALHIPSLPGDNHKVSQLSWWGLVVDDGSTREDGGRAGYWRLTTKGVAFVTRRLTIPMYVRIYDARVGGYVGPEVSIVDCLGQRFDYAELMAQ